MHRGISVRSGRRGGPITIWPEPEPEEDGANDELEIVGLRDLEVAADRRQGGKHRVDGERAERHQEGRQRNEFARMEESRGSLSAHGSLRCVFTGGRSLRAMIPRSSQSPAGRARRATDSPGMGRPPVRATSSPVRFPDRLTGRILRSGRHTGEEDHA